MLSLQYSGRYLPLHCSMEAEAHWNADLGIWQDLTGKAVVKVEKRLAEGAPLYIFGYGSLIWRPGDVLGAFESWEVACVDHGRLFAQYSHDHRGTPVFPGLVCTLQPLPEVASPGSGASGRAWLIPHEEAARVLEVLDEREKGGYSRTIIGVRLLEESTPHFTRGQQFDAVVYLGSPGNPNFFAGAGHAGDALSRTANIISVAEGASGRNVDYLLSLSHYLHTTTPSYQATPAGDPYLHALSRAVWQRMYSRGGDCWAQRALREACTHTNRLDIVAAAAHSVEEEEPGQNRTLSAVITASELADEGSGAQGALLATAGPAGWGSNEYAQLDGAGGVGPGQYRLSAAPAWVISPDSNAMPEREREREADCHVLAGGGSSALLFSRWSELRLAGQLCLSAAAPADSFDTRRVSLWGVAAAALGHERVLVLCNSGQFLDVRRDDGSAKVPVAEGGAAQVAAPSFVTPVQLSEVEAAQASGATAAAAAAANPASRVVHAAAGLRHSACVTADGVGHTWGDARWGQAAPAGQWPQPVGQHYPQAVPHFVRVSCGTRHTAFVSSVGEVFSSGSAKHGALGRPGGSDGLGRVPLDPLTRWTDVRSGWAHNVAKGVGPDGRVCFTGWGRCDLGQWAYAGPAPEGAVDVAGNVLVPLPLALPPTAEPCSWLEVWCGAEHTVACDAHGGLWSTGWDAHGVLGQGIAPVSEKKEEKGKRKEEKEKGEGEAVSGSGGQWRPVRDAAGQQVCVCVRGGTARHGAVACGGGHCLCLSLALNTC